MADQLDPTLDDNAEPASPTKTLGVMGTAVYGGYVENREKNAALSTTRERQLTYSDILANTSIVAAGTRYFLNLVAKANWFFRPSPADTTGDFARFAEKAITEDPTTPWHRIVRRAAMYRFYGFSIQEWTMKRDERTGRLVYKDVAPRAQLTIEKWDVEEDGTVLGVIQRSPQTAREIYLPRPKLMYLVDDTISDSPEGLGLYRHIVESAESLRRYEQLEGFGYETDLRGIPIGRVPLGELAEAVESGAISETQRQQTIEPMRTFIENHIRTPNLGLLLDSVTYESKDEAGRASAAKQWDVELLKGGAPNFAEIAKAIDRLNREMARVLGVEQLMLGSDGAGSFALSRDKTSSFFLLIDGALMEVQAGVEDDLLDPLWKINGFPEEMKPIISIEAVRHTDVAEVTGALRDMATAGAILEVDDPVIGQVRDLLGVERPLDISERREAEDASLMTGGEQDTEQDLEESPNDREEE